MSKILPLKAVWPEDSESFGQEIANLAKMRQFKFPVPEGIVIAVPRDEIGSVIESRSWTNLTAFENNFGEIKRIIGQIEPPSELSELLKSRKVQVGSLWRELIDGWVDELRQAIALGKKYPLQSLNTKYVLFTGVIKASGKAYFDRTNQDSEIVIESGKLSPQQLKTLDQSIGRLNKLFLTDNIYHWVIDSELRFTRVVPYSEQTLIEGQSPSVESKAVSRLPEWPKSATKIWWSLESLVIDPRCDGVMLRAEQFGSIPELQFSLIEAAHSFGGKEVILRLGDFRESWGVAGGCFSLLQRKSVLEQEVECLLQARNKRGLNNVSVGLPLVRSAEELKQIKRTLIAIGVTRKSSLKLWLEMSSAENWLNLEQYVMVGFDGILLNLESLMGGLGGYDPNVAEATTYLTDFSGLIKFLNTYLKLAHKYRLPVVAFGRPLQNDEVVKALIKNGVFGVMPHSANLEQLKWEIAKYEKAL